MLAGALFLVGAVIAAPAFIDGVDQIRSGILLGGFLRLVTPQALVVAGIGLWLVKRWAVWLTAIALLLFAFRGAEAVLDHPEPPGAAWGVGVMVIAALLLAYLTRPSVKAAFRRPDAG